MAAVPWFDSLEPGLRDWLRSKNLSTMWITELTKNTSTAEINAGSKRAVQEIMPRAQRGAGATSMLRWGIDVAIRGPFRLPGRPIRS